MKKFFYIFFVLFCMFGTVFAYEKPEIITREEWGANESFLYLDGPEWKSILKKNEEAAKKAAEKNTGGPSEESWGTRMRKAANKILTEEYSEYLTLSERSQFYNGRELAWPIEKSSRIRGIAIHHTHTEYKNDRDAVRSIYRFHALSRQWGDIGYNFLIGKNGKIYEGRFGGETTVAAHAKYNNRQTIGIALIGNYQDTDISLEQYLALERLVTYLAEKHSINMGQKEVFFKKCFTSGCARPIIVQRRYPLIGHRDVGNTTCPGDVLYNRIANLRLHVIKNLQGGSNSKLRKDINKPQIEKAKEIRKKEATIKEDPLYKKFDSIGEKKLILLASKIEQILEQKDHKQLRFIKTKIRNYIAARRKKTKDSSIDTKKIKIRLSYPKDDFIEIFDGEKIHKVSREGDELIKDGKKRLAFKFPIKNGEYVEIVSWERKPAWDKQDRYNDNKFRGELSVYIKDGALVVVNELPIGEYLKGLGEIGNDVLPEKAKAIIVSARTYAYFYTSEENRKHPGEWYDGTDDPNSFQNYLGYEFEKRSPKVAQIVKSTKGIIVRYNGQPIKTWYFNSSSGKTKSYYDFCLDAFPNDYCKKDAQKYPYLKSKIDFGGIGKAQNGHGVGLSGVGATYFAKRSWNYDMILKYFYEGVDVY